MKRAILEIVLLILIVISPWWWVSVLFSVFLLYHFKYFNEIILFGLLIDILYGKGDYRFTLFFLVLLLTSFFIKKRLKFYSK